MAAWDSDRNLCASAKQLTFVARYSIDMEIDAQQYCDKILNDNKGNLFFQLGLEQVEVCSDPDVLQAMEETFDVILQRTYRLE